MRVCPVCLAEEECVAEAVGGARCTDACACPDVAGGVVVHVLEVRSRSSTRRAFCNRVIVRTCSAATEGVSEEALVLAGRAGGAGGSGSGSGRFVGSFTASVFGAIRMPTARTMVTMKVQTAVVHRRHVPERDPFCSMFV